MVGLFGRAEDRKDLDDFLIFWCKGSFIGKATKITGCGSGMDLLICQGRDIKADLQKQR